jgi:hypothetical protein
MAPLRHRRANLVFLANHKEPDLSMSEITTIGLDLAKHVFQVHGIDAEGTTVLRKRLRRGQVVAFFSRLPRCLVGLEACATAHYWARELQQNVVPTTTPAGKVMFQMMGVLAELRARQDPRTSPC